MCLAQVVGVRVDLFSQVINPDQRTTVLVRQREGGIMLAGWTRTLTGHVSNLILTSPQSVDFRMVIRRNPRHNPRHDTSRLLPVT
jgi:hypothetical protein